ncbi:MAG: sensor histidine kinase [Chloroflexi bacterium]|nr:sensor histidine kinase [Chloroflexota bacterium]
MDDRLLDLGLSETDKDFLDNIQQNMPLLADLLRADLLTYCLDSTRSSAVVVAEAKPRLVPSLHPDPMMGTLVGVTEQPAIHRALTEGKHERWRSHSVSGTVQAVHDVFPIFNGGRAIAGLSVEISHLELERLRKKSAVFRAAIAQLRDMLLRGQLLAGNAISPLGQHDAPLIVDSTGHILYISTIAENLYRRLGNTGPFVNSSLKDLNSDESLFFHALETGTCAEQLVEEGTLTWVRKAIPLIPSLKSSWQSSLPTSWPSRLLTKNREIEGVLLVIHDVTEERRKEQELRVKSAMIREVHHRVKNNLQTIASLLRLQARRLDSDLASEMLSHSVNRILSVAVVHEFLSHDESSIIDIKELCQRIIKEVTQSVLDSERRIRISLEGQNVYLPSQQATSCALIVNELLQNAVEHGFPAGSDGSVVVRLQDLGSDLVVEIADNGRGLGQGFRVGGSSSLGLQIVQTLVKEDLKGNFELINGGGARAVVTFPKLWRGTGIPWAEVRSK